MTYTIQTARTTYIVENKAIFKTGVNRSCFDVSADCVQLYDGQFAKVLTHGITANKYGVKVEDGSLFVKRIGCEWEPARGEYEFEQFFKVVKKKS